MRCLVAAVVLILSGCAASRDGAAAGDLAAGGDQPVARIALASVRETGGGWRVDFELTGDRESTRSLATALEHKLGVAPSQVLQFYAADGRKLDVAAIEIELPPGATYTPERVSVIADGPRGVEARAGAWVRVQGRPTHVRALPNTLGAEIMRREGLELATPVFDTRLVGVPLG